MHVCTHVYASLGHVLFILYGMLQISFHTTNVGAHIFYCLFEPQLSDVYLVVVVSLH